MTVSPVIDRLLDWVIEQNARGAVFSASAIQAAGEAVVIAESTGLPPERCFEAGRAAYFDTLVEESRDGGKGHPLDARLPAS
jgi:hypothetical protein